MTHGPGAGARPRGDSPSAGCGWRWGGGGLGDGRRTATRRPWHGSWRPAVPVGPCPQGGARKRSVMERRRLGRTDLQVSVLGFGGAEIGDGRAPQVAVDRLLGEAPDAG